jgi:hypothetical protein
MTSGLTMNMNKTQYIEKKIQQKKIYQQKMNRTHRLVCRNEMKRIYQQNIDRTLRLLRRNMMKHNSFSFPDKLDLKNVFQEKEKTDRALRLIRRNRVRHIHQQKMNRMTHLIHKNDVKNDVKNEVSIEISNINITPKNRIISNTTEKYSYFI